VIVNLTDRPRRASRARQLDLLATIGPDGIAREVARLEGGRTPPHSRRRCCRIS
jgi:hypothetical protein